MISERRLYRVFFDVLFTSITLTFLFLFIPSSVFSKSFFMFFLVTWVYSIYLFDGYDLRVADHPYQNLAVIFSSSIMASFFVIFFHDAFRINVSSVQLLLSGLINGLVIGTHRYLYSKILGRSPEELRVLLHGSGDPKDLSYIDEMTKVTNGMIQYARAKVVDREPIDEFVRIIVKERIDTILISKEAPRSKVGIETLEKLEETGIRVINIEDFYEEICMKIPIRLKAGEWDYSWSEWFSERSTYHKLKVVMNLAIGIPLLMLFTPILCVAVFAIFIEGGFPVFYSQRRVGKKGKVFNLLKLRTMQKKAEEDGEARWATVNDERITKVGSILRRLRIDELPQLWNVLRGDMNLVGPRPERPEFQKDLSKEIPFFNRRNVVRPGITGWAQIRYPYGSSIQDSLHKLTYDLWYIKNRSIMLDLLILIETVFVVIGRKGSR